MNSVVDDLYTTTNLAKNNTYVLYRLSVSPLRWSSSEEKHTVNGLPIALPVVGSQSLSSPSLLPLTSCLPSGDHAMHSTQFLCPVQPTHISTSVSPV